MTGGSATATDAGGLSVTVDVAVFFLAFLVVEAFGVVFFLVTFFLVVPAGVFFVVTAVFFLVVFFFVLVFLVVRVTFFVVLATILLVEGLSDRRGPGEAGGTEWVVS